MIISFTGTRQGMTPRQFGTVQKLLRVLEPSEVHHGDCIGADVQFSAIANDLKIRIMTHPPKDEKKRAFCKASVIKRWPPMPFLTRNKQLVNCSELLIATPHRPEYLRSGTWSTVRYARKQHKTIIIIEP